MGIFALLAADLPLRLSSCDDLMRPVGSRRQIDCRTKFPLLATQLQNLGRMSTGCHLAKAVSESQSLATQQFHQGRNGHSSMKDLEVPHLSYFLGRKCGTGGLRRT
jgi:hypothetical protein